MNEAELFALMSVLSNDETCAGKLQDLLWKLQFIFALLVRLSEKFACGGFCSSCRWFLFVPEDNFRFLCTAPGRVSCTEKRNTCYSTLSRVNWPKDVWSGVPFPHAPHVCVSPFEDRWHLRLQLLQTVVAMVSVANDGTNHSITSDIKEAGRA